MHILEVIPLINLPQNAPQILSYFSNTPLSKGAIVKVNFNNRLIDAVVISSESIESRKIDIKKTLFQLKKVSSLVSESPEVKDYHLKLAVWLSKKYFSPPSLALRSVLPRFFLKKNYDLGKFSFAYKKAETAPTPRFILSQSYNCLEVIESSTKRIIKDGGQVLVIVPEMTVLKYFSDHFSNNYSLAVIHGGLNNKTLYSGWEQSSSGRAQMIIGTRQAILAPYNNLRMIIVEDPDHEAYKSDMSPKYNTRDFASYMAELHGAELVFLSGFQTIADFHRQKIKAIPIENRLTNNTSVQIINMADQLMSGHTSLISRDIEKEIRNRYLAGENTLIFSSRKGYSGTLMCANCGLTAKCSQCSIPMRVQKIPEPALVCYHCSLTRKIPTVCPNCNSSKIKAVGMPGSQKIKDAIERIFQNENETAPNIAVFDTGIIKKPEEEQKLLDSILGLKPSILIASHLLFSYRYKLNFNFIGIPNTDGLINIPDFKTEERMLYHLNKLTDLRPEKIMLQTFYPENRALNAFAAGQYSQFFEEELESRKLFFYPPFSRLVKISTGNKNRDTAFYRARTLSEKLKLVISQLTMTNDVKLTGPFPTFIEKEREMWNYNIVLKVNPEFSIEKILKFVPSDWRIDVDPARLI